jgi:hypothetical protein
MTDEDTTEEPAESKPPLEEGGPQRIANSAPSPEEIREANQNSTDDSE